MGKKLFVSYSRSDAEPVATLVSDLENFDHKAWMDRDLTGGQLWWNEVLRNIREADAFVFALSPHSASSKACMSEFEYASTLGKPVLPVVVERGFSESLLPASIGQVQRVDYTTPDRAALSRLIKAVTSTPDAPPLAEPFPEPPAIPATYMFDLNQEIGSSEAIDADKQDQLIAQLKHQMSESDDVEAIQTIIGRFRQREDLLVRVSRELDELETKVSSGRPSQSRPEPTSAPRPRPAPERQPVIPPPAEQPVDTSTQPLQPTVASTSVNGAWWIAPILFGIIGGVVAWVVNKNVDAKTARNMLITGVVINVLYLVFAGGF